LSVLGIELVIWNADDDDDDPLNNELADDVWMNSTSTWLLFDKYTTRFRPKLSLTHATIE
jgi:hypothetical protein